MESNMESNMESKEFNMELDMELNMEVQCTYFGSALLFSEQYDSFVFSVSSDFLKMASNMASSKSNIQQPRQSGFPDRVLKSKFMRDNMSRKRLFLSDKLIWKATI